jgi:hypothetical protein
MSALLKIVVGTLLLATAAWAVETCCGTDCCNGQSACCRRAK